MEEQLALHLRERIDDPARRIDVDPLEREGIVAPAERDQAVEGAPRRRDLRVRIPAEEERVFIGPLEMAEDAGVQMGARSELPDDPVVAAFEIDDRGSRPLAFASIDGHAFPVRAHPREKVIGVGEEFAHRGEDLHLAGRRGDDRRHENEHEKESKERASCPARLRASHRRLLTPRMPRPGDA